MIVVLGANGGLGSGLFRLIASRPTVEAEFGTLVGAIRANIDVAVESSVAAFCESLRLTGPLTEPLHLINATGVSYSNLAHKTSADDFDKTVRVNLRGAFLLAKYLQPVVKVRPGSSIVFLSSVVADLGVPGTVAYAASKAGLRGMVRTLSAEFARVNCRVNALELGYFDAGMIDQVKEETKNTLRSEIPLNRFGTISELYAACEFTLRCGYLTGAVVKVNGGLR